ncbi:astacin-like [Toxorhynchites rutilus septentrionalis]|uniref:astacin-like n=1 Tax=Toxorhynchites rutilus septentrionalis TaxID=329112 RepID=UPI0024792697|nr:astacin-like [Toxorhynchites rutilus septentrionalis]
MNGWIRLAILTVLLCGIVTARRGRFRVPIRNGHKRGDRHFAIRPHDEVGRRMRHYKRSVNKTFPFEQGMGIYFQGDIMLRPELEENAIRSDNNPNVRWPNGVVPFKITGKFTADEIAIIKKALSNISAQTCIRFVDCQNGQICLPIDNSASGCWSYVGRSDYQQYNNVNLQTPGCMTTGTVTHEILHALGLYHEHIRPDRDEYLLIDRSALLPEYNTTTFWAANYEKMQYPQVELFGLSYDYGSVMHYSRYAAAASSNKPVFVNKKPWNKDFGNEVGMSASDITRVKKMYCNALSG